MKLYKILVVSIITLNSCRNNSDYTEYHGEAQGTTFLIKYHSVQDMDLESQIDSVFNLMDILFSGYIDHSYVSQFNRSHSGLPVNTAFMELWEKCWELNIETDGYFDPTLAPVIDGFKKMSGNVVDSALILDRLSHTGLPLLIAKGDSLIKKDSLVKIDLDAIAQGFTVDVLARLMEKYELKNYLIEVGGEVFAKGKNDEGKIWTIGLDKPTEGERKLMASLEMDGISMATSGNYRKFKVVGGKKIGHILNPKTGFPVETNILSVSVITRYCYRADALATALMNRTSAEIRDFDMSNTDLQVILVELVNSDTVIYASPEIQDKLKF